MSVFLDGFVGSRGASVSGGTLPFIDVTASPYSADPTGSRDSTQAFQAAVDGTPTGASLMVPAGHYRISSPIHIMNSSVMMIGLGERISVIQYSGSGPCFKLGPLDSGLAIGFNKICGMTIDGSGNTNVKTAVEVNDGEQ